MADIFDQIAAKNKKKSGDIFDQIAAQSSPQQVPVAGQDRPGFLALLQSGAKTGISGQLAQYEPEPLPEDASVFERMAYNVGHLGSDLPAILAGHAVTGGLGGGFAAPELFRQIQEYRKKPPSETWTEALANLAQIPWETGKQALVGKITGAGARAFPALAKTGLGKSIAAGIGGGTGALAGQALVERRMPSAKEALDMAMLVGAMHVGGLGAKGIRKGISKITPEPVKARAKALKVKAKEVVKEPLKPLIEQYEKEKPSRELLKKYVGEARASAIENSFKWRKESHALLKDATPKQLEEAIYARQRTGNPNIKGDTPEKLRKRQSPKVLKFLETTADKHFREQLKAKRKHPYLKEVSPRQIIEETYLPGLYEYTDKFGSIYQKVAKKFNYKDPASDMKTFLSYDAALKKAGMKPRYNNILDIMRANDVAYAKTIAGADLLQDIAKIEKNTGRKIIVTARDSKSVINDAKAEGYTPIDNAFLKAFTPEGAKSPTLAPAYVAPEFADAFKSLFPEPQRAPGLLKKAFNLPGQLYDHVNDIYRGLNVSMGLFHFNPLIESISSAEGKSLLTSAKGIFHPFKSGRHIMRRGENYMNSAKEMARANRRGLVVHPQEEYRKFKGAISKTLEFPVKAIKWATPDPVIEKVGKMAQSAWDKIPGGIKSNAAVRGTAKGVDAAVRRLTGIPDFLFKKFHPRLKMVAWNDYVDAEVLKRTKEGKRPSPKEIIKIEEGMADLVNNTFGGQNWEVQRFFDNPYARRWMRRLMGYPDWTISAIKQGAGPFSSDPMKAKAALKYWLKFGMNMAILQSTYKFVFGGMYQSDKENMSPAGIRWSVDKALKEFTEPDPLEWHKFPLPDVPVKIAGKEFNPGREQKTAWNRKGSKFYVHYGKQMHELEGWYNHPFRTGFAKSSPNVRGILKQVLEKTPGTDKDFAVRGKYVRGKGWMPWDATEPGTAARAISRIKSFIGDAVPFSMRALYDKGLAPYLATGGASLPISKGTTPNKAEVPLEKAFKEKDYKMVTRIKRALRDNGFTTKRINRLVNQARRRARG